MQTSYYVDIKFLNLISTRLKLFKKKSDALWNCRCPFCGDSKKNQKKARGYFYKKSNKILYKCHNCDVGMSLSSVLKQIDSKLHSEYKLENFLQTDSKPAQKEIIHKQTVVESKSIDIGLESILELPNSHPAKKYVVSRKIPVEHYTRLFYSESYSDWIKRYDVIGRYSNLQSDARLVIPIFDQSGNILGAQGRSLDPKEEIRYITCKWSDDGVFMYGLDRWSPGYKTYVVEGPLDSLFLPNSIACMCSDFVGCVKRLQQKFLFPRNTLTLVFDNEKRKPEIQSKLKSAIDSGYNVCIWPNSLKEKDVNDMILANLTKEDVVSLIDSRTYKDLFAQLEFSNTCKVSLKSK